MQPPARLVWLLQWWGTWPHLGPGMRTSVTPKMAVGEADPSLACANHVSEWSCRSKLCCAALHLGHSWRKSATLLALLCSSAPGSRSITEMGPVLRHVLHWC